jgi:hypothetical protein
MRLAVFHRRRPQCRDDRDDLAMARTLLVAASLRLWRVMDDPNTETLIGALIAFDGAATVYAREITRAANTSQEEKS